ncbi:hypothetical protein LXL04_013242 [Taraxacum kok-saghyz]
MDPNSWTRFSTSNSALKRYQSRLDAFHLVEETDNDRRPEYLCPLCAKDFDIVGLCCHIDEEHTLQAKNGVSNYQTINQQHHHLFTTSFLFLLNYIAYFQSSKKALKNGNLLSIAHSIIDVEFVNLYIKA